MTLRLGCRWVFTANLRRYSTAQANHQVGSVETSSRSHQRAETSPVTPIIKSGSRGQHVSSNANGRVPEGRHKTLHIAHHLATFRQTPPPSTNIPPTISFPRIDAFLGKVSKSPDATPAVKPNSPLNHRAAVKGTVKHPAPRSKRTSLEERNYPPAATQQEDRGPKRSPPKSRSNVQLPPDSYFPPMEEIDFGKLFLPSPSTGTPPLHAGSESKMLQVVGGDYSRHLPQHLRLHQVEGSLTPSESARIALARRKDVGLHGRNTASKVVKSASQGRGGKQQT